MTGLGQRVADLFHQKANDVINKAEDPRQALDYAYSQAQDLLTKVRGGLAAIATARAGLMLRTRISPGRRRNWKARRNARYARAVMTSRTRPWSVR